MGNRALIQLINKSGAVSPVLYMRNGGGNVANILLRTQTQMKGRASDVDSAFARLVQQAINGDNSSSGIGVWNQAERLTEDDSHGDAGCFVVDVSAEAWTVAQGGGYGLGDEHSFPVTELQQVSA